MGDKYGKPNEATPEYWKEGYLSEKDKALKALREKNQAAAVAVSESVSISGNGSTVVVSEKMEVVEEDAPKKRKRASSVGTSDEPDKKKSKKEKKEKKEKKDKKKKKKSTAD